MSNYGASQTSGAFYSYQPGADTWNQERQIVPFQPPVQPALPPPDEFKLPSSGSKFLHCAVCTQGFVGSPLSQCGCGISVALCPDCTQSNPIPQAPPLSKCVYCRPRAHVCLSECQRACVEKVARYAKAKADKRVPAKKSKLPHNNQCGVKCKGCGKGVPVQTSKSAKNPGRRYHACRSCKRGWAGWCEGACF